MALLVGLTDNDDKNKLVQMTKIRLLFQRGVMYLLCAFHFSCKMYCYMGQSLTFHKYIY